MAGGGGQMTFEEDEPGAAKERASKLMIARLRREAIEDLLRARRPNGEPLADVAIAVRVGCSPSEVAKVRAETNTREDS